MVFIIIINLRQSCVGQQPTILTEPTRVGANFGPNVGICGARIGGVCCGVSEENFAHPFNILRAILWKGKDKKTNTTVSDEPPPSFLCASGAKIKLD